MDVRYRIKVRGAFDVCNSVGAPILGLGKKAQAVIAILSVDCGRWVTRGLLQDLLWSDRGPEHGRNSLRKSLSQIRKATSEITLIEERHGGYIRISPERAAIDLFEPEIVWGSDTVVDYTGLELLEGMNVRDNEFDEWLRQKRLECAKDSDLPRPDVRPSEIRPSGKTEGRSISLPRVGFRFCQVRLCENNLESIFAFDFSKQALVSAFLRADISELVENEATFRDCDAFVELLVSTIGERHYLRVIVRQADGHSPVWSEFELAENSARSIEASSYTIAEKAVDAVFHHFLGASSANSERLIVGLNTCRALSGLFNVGTLSPREIESCLDTVQLYHQSPRITIWRAAASAMRLVEKPGRFGLEEREKIEAYLRDALQFGSNDSTVLAVAGHLYGRILGDQARALALTSRAVEKDRQSALSWLFRASSLYRVDDVRNASFAATRAFQLGANSFADAFFSSVRSYTSLANRDFATSVSFGERLRSSPACFRSNARVLAASYGLLGDIESGRKVVASYCGHTEAIDEHLAADAALKAHSELGERVISTGLAQLK